MLTVSQFAGGATIPAQYAANANFTVAIVNAIFERFPNQFKFNSGYRTPAHNADVGGVANSFHVTAQAADIAPINGNFNQYKSALTEMVASFGYELIDERAKNHFHIEPNPGATINKVVPANIGAAAGASGLLLLGLVALVVLKD